MILFILGNGRQSKHLGLAQKFHMFFADDLIRFGEASYDQVNVMESILRCFCS